MSHSRATTWKDWASEWGLDYHAPRFLTSTREWLAGSYRGYLVRMGWLGDRTSEFYAVIRFPQVPDGSIIRRRLLEDPSLADLPGWTRLKPAGRPKPAQIGRGGSGVAAAGLRLHQSGGRSLQVDDSSLLWTIPFSWRQPGADQLKDWVGQLLEALSRTSRTFQGRCEQCGCSVGRRFVMVDDLPAYLCDDCQQGVNERAEEAYEQSEAKHLTGALYAGWGAIVGGVLWAFISYSTQHLLAPVAIGVAALVGLAYRHGAKKLDRAGQAIGVALTMAGVILGDVLYCVMTAATQHPGAGLHVRDGWSLFTGLLARGSGDVVLSLLVGVVGSGLVARVLARPRFAVRVEAAESPESWRRAA